MNLVQLLIFWLLGWVMIIVLRTIYIRYPEHADDFASRDMVEDGNNLFSTGLVYFFANIICTYFEIATLRWVLMILGIIFAIPSCASVILLLFSKGVPIQQKIAAFICSYIPLLMALNIGYNYLF